MSKQTAKQRVVAIHTCLLSNKKIETISELSRILKISSSVPRILKNMNVLLYNSTGKVIWNPNVPYTVELERDIHAKVLEYARKSQDRVKAKTIEAEEAALAEKARQEEIAIYENEMSFIYENEMSFFDEDDLEAYQAKKIAEDKVSFVEHAIISLEVSIADLHKKLDALTAKVSELNVDSKVKSRVRLIPTPSTNISTKHNFFSEDL